jgi:hypothetical protein
MPIRPPNNRIALVYGYVVCLCSLGFIVLGLNLSLPNFVRLMTFDATGTASYRNPGSFREFKDAHVEHRIQLTRLLRGGRAERDNSAAQNMSSLERAQLSGAALDSVTYVPLKLSDVTVLPDSQLRAEYRETQMADAANLKRDLQSNLISGLQMALIAAIVFFLHWRWVQGFSNFSATTSAPSVPAVVEPSNS